MTNGLEDVAGGQDGGVQLRLLLFGDVPVELVVQLQATDLREVVALRVEEEVVEEVPRGVQRGRIAGAKAPVDLEDRLVLGLDLVRQEGVAEVGADVQAVDEENLDGLDLRLAKHLHLLFGDLLVHAEEDLAGLLVDDVLGADLAEHLGLVDRQALEASGLELADRGAGELPVPPHDDVGVDLDVAGRALAGEQVVLDRLGELAASLEVEGLGVVVEVEQVVGRVTQGLEEHGRVHLPAAVDADVEQVLRVELEVQPGAAVGDDPRLVEELARGVGLALVVVEEDAGAAVQLADDDALGPVDDEGTVLRHQGDLTEVDLLLLDVANGTLTALRGVVDDELDRDLDRRRVGHAALAALVHVVLGALEGVPLEDQLAGPVEVADGEDALEDALQTDVFPLAAGHRGLEELVVRALLDVDQVRDVEKSLDLPEAMPDPEVGLDLRRHWCLQLPTGLYGWSRTGPAWPSPCAAGFRPRNKKSPEFRSKWTESDREIPLLTSRTPGRSQSTPMTLGSPSRREGCAHALASTAGDLTHREAIGKQSACHGRNSPKTCARGARITSG